jgi:hypothetical protein
MLSVVMLSVVMLSVVMLSVVMLSVAAPEKLLKIETTFLVKVSALTLNWNQRCANQ